MDWEPSGIVSFGNRRIQVFAFGDDFFDLSELVLAGPVEDCELAGSVDLFKCHFEPRRNSERGTSRPFTQFEEGHGIKGASMMIWPLASSRIERSFVQS